MKICPRLWDEILEDVWKRPRLWDKILEAALKNTHFH